MLLKATRELEMDVENNIQNFWRWFSDVADKFGDKFQNESLINELDARIAQIGPISWEIGPGFHNEAASALVFSPAGDAALLPLTKRIIANAPPCRGWEFYSSKPPKKWDRQFVVEDGSGNTYEVDASNCTYVLLRYPDQTIDIVICAPETVGFSPEVLDTIGTVLVDGEIGESLRIEAIENIECIPKYDDDTLMSKSKPITLLAKHIIHVLESSP